MAAHPHHSDQVDVPGHRVDLVDALDVDHPLSDLGDPVRLDENRDDGGDHGFSPRTGRSRQLGSHPRAYASVGIAVRAKRRGGWAWSNAARAGWLKLPPLSAVATPGPSRQLHRVSVVW